MPDNIRMKRIEAFFQQELSRIVSRELKDPVFENKLISFTSIGVSKDLSSAHVNVSVLGNGNETPKVVIALNKAARVIRNEIMQVSELRHVPNFTFHEDYAIEAASNIDSLLDKIEIPPEDPEESDDENKSEV